jgi:hypothetical protein
MSRLIEFVPFAFNLVVGFCAGLIVMLWLFWTHRLTAPKEHHSEIILPGDK